MKIDNETIDNPQAGGDIFNNGMTLFDYYYGQAVISIATTEVAYRKEEKNPIIRPTELARDAFALAKEMLKERNTRIQE